jgi:hypothetical protein
LQDYDRRVRALGLLCDDLAFRWLCDGKAMTAGGAKWKPAILTELGRIDDEDDLREVARQLCELKPKTKDAIAAVRRWRLGKKSGMDAAAALRRAVVRPINRSLLVGELTPGEVMEVLLSILSELGSLPPPATDSARNKRGRARRR